MIAVMAICQMRKRTRRSGASSLRRTGGGDGGAEFAMFVSCAAWRNRRLRRCGKLYSRVTKAREPGKGGNALAGRRFCSRKRQIKEGSRGARRVGGSRR